MAHHKRRRPKHQRNGCLYCKPHKDEREPKTTSGGNLRREQATKQDLKAHQEHDRG